MSKIKKKNFIFVSLLLAIVCGLAYCLPTFINSKQISQTTSAVRTIEVKQNEIDFQASFEQFENAVLESNEKVTTFEGTKTFNLLDFCEIDLVSELDANATAEIEVKYHYNYDAELNVITLTATLIDEEGNVIIDSMSGVPFVDENGNLDCVFDCDGEYILLSELQDAGMIENCGWFKNLCKKVSTAVKKVCDTTIGKIGAVATIAVPAVIGVVCAVAAAPVVATVAVGALVGAGIATGTAAISTYQQDGKVDWETVGICAGVGAAVGAISSYSAYKITSAIKSLFPKANPSSNVKSFDTYDAFKKEYGKASDYVPDGEWHHIVEQQTVTKGINAGSTVYNSQNTVAISKNLHHEISKYYSTKNPTLGMTYRQYVNTLPYEQQYAEGLKVLKMFADKLGETIIWL